MSAVVPAIPLEPSAARVARGNWRRRLLIVIAVGYIGFLIVTPVAALLWGAAQQGIGAILTALSDPQVLSAFGRTLLIAAIVVGIHAVGGTTVAWVLVRDRFPGRHVVNAMIDLPFAVSPVVAGYMLLLLFGRQGLFAPLLQDSGFRIAFALPGMILATLFVTLPFMVRELMPVLEAFGRDQEEAAHTLGASGWQTFRRVTFPALRHGFWYGIVLTLARALGEFGAVLVVSGGVQGRTETATVYVYRALDDRQYAGAYSAALVLGLISLVLVLGAELRRGKRHAVTR
jgi:sulfate/thiosulfate transport system permease protein